MATRAWNNLSSSICKTKYIRIGASRCLPHLEQNDRTGLLAAFFPRPCSRSNYPLVCVCVHVLVYFFEHDSKPIINSPLSEKLVYHVHAKQHVQVFRRQAGNAYCRPRDLGLQRSAQKLAGSNKLSHPLDKCKEASILHGNLRWQGGPGQHLSFAQAHL